MSHSHAGDLVGGWSRQTCAHSRTSAGLPSCLLFAQGNATYFQGLAQRPPPPTEEPLVPIMPLAEVHWPGVGEEFHSPEHFHPSWCLVCG